MNIWIVIAIGLFVVFFLQGFVNGVKKNLKKK